MNTNPWSPRFSGKRLLKNELNLSESVFQGLLDKAYLKEIPGIKKAFFYYECQRCHTRKPTHFGKIPTKTIQLYSHKNLPATNSITYCRKCIQMGRVSTIEPLYEWNGPVARPPKVKQPSIWRGELTTLQSKAADAMVEAIRKQSKLLIHAVCGAGKTEMLYRGLWIAFRNGFRVCIATPRADVVRELAPRLRRDFPSIEVAALYGGTQDEDVTAHLVIATTHQLLRYSKSFDVMIVDEVDAFPYHHDKSLPKAVARSVKESHALIYLTATPRLDLKIASRLKQLQTISIPLRYHGHPLPLPKLSQVFKLHQHLQQGTLPKKITHWIDQRKAAQRRFLLFVPTIETAQFLSKKLDIPYVHSESSNREELIHQFRNQQYEALITTTILERGVTFPSIDVAVIGADHDVFDEAALVQIAGRAGRSADDPDGDVTFFYNVKTKAIVKARQYTELKNLEGKKFKKENN
uniref:DEAD/DEAH box helicase n=1 Tax=uncultured Allobacillus sp. TaxID=1638025 RepID=UPI002595EBCA|nr:helicase-related protein [uncultured Allobacillus sp.]